jgi:hypothetical protein
MAEQKEITALESMSRLSKNRVVQGFLTSADNRPGTTTKGKPMLRFHLANNEGVVWPVVVWDDNVDRLHTVLSSKKVGAFLELEGVNGGLFQNTVQLVATNQTKIVQRDRPNGQRFEPPHRTMSEVFAICKTIEEQTRMFQVTLVLEDVNAVYAGTGAFNLACL